MSKKMDDKPPDSWGGFGTAQIDAMVWQFCLGVLDVANSGSYEGDCDTLNQIHDDRVLIMYKSFKVRPSFLVAFGQHNGRFTIDKTSNVDAFFKSKGIFK
jgi:hypothetical protein